jgi:hypothetical protein
MSIRYRHGLIAGFVGGWAFGTLTTGYLAITSILPSSLPWSFPIIGAG